MFKAANIWLVSQTDWSKLVLGAFIVLIVVAFPQGHRRHAGCILARRRQASAETAARQSAHRDAE